MANEITVLERTARDKYSLLFLYPVTPIQPDGATNLVLTPSAGLPEIAAMVLDQAEKDALDTGILAFAVETFTDPGGVAGAELLARAREMYAEAEAHFQTIIAARYVRSGERYDATA